jgi:hypothetical protein
VKKLSDREIYVNVDMAQKSLFVNKTIVLTMGRIPAKYTAWQHIEEKTYK